MEVSQSESLDFARNAMIRSRSTTGKTRVSRRWSKILVGKCEKGHPMEGFAIKQVRVGWCKKCGKEEELK